MSETLDQKIGETLSGRGPEELDALYLKLQGELVRRQTQLTNLFDELAELRNSRYDEIADMNPDNLDEQTRAFFEAIGVDLQKIGSISLSRYASLTSEFRVQYGISGVFSDRLRFPIGPNAGGCFLSRTYYDKNGVRIMHVDESAGRMTSKSLFAFSSISLPNDVTQKQLEDEFGTAAGQVVFRILATPFSRLAFIENLVEFGQKAREK